ncbi:MAG TPA: hypothetical protein VIH90_03065 [Candidatus Saccharimonadales bacterium]
MSVDSTTGSRFVSLPEAYAAVYAASDSILEANQGQTRDEEEHPLIAEHISGLLDSLSALKPVPGQRLYGAPLVNVSGFLSGLHEQIIALDKELTMQNGGVLVPFKQLTPELSALCTVTIQVEASLNSVDRSLN